MTEVVVTDKTHTVVVEDSGSPTVITESSQPQVIVTGIMGPPGASTFGQLQDIDLTQLGSGSTLVYNTQTQKWTATTLLDQQVIESGQF